MKRIVAIVLLFVLITCAFSGCVEKEVTPPPTPTPTPTPVPTGNISVKTDPVNGAIYINGEYVGTKYAYEELLVGTYTITFGNVSG